MFLSVKQIVSECSGHLNSYFSHSLIFVIVGPFDVTYIAQVPKRIPEGLTHGLQCLRVQRFKRSVLLLHRKIGEAAAHSFTAAQDVEVESIQVLYRGIGFFICFHSVPYTRLSFSPFRPGWMKYRNPSIDLLNPEIFPLHFHQGHSRIRQTSQSCRRRSLG